MPNHLKKYVRLRERNQITIPADIIEGLAVEVGGFLEIARTEDNSIQLRPTALVIMNTEQSVKEEKLALENSAMEVAKEITNPNEFFKHVEEVETERRKKSKRPAAAAAF
jgi:bifunctional DNA-binding transcriptional regulator/antitoxin component of YhaV-PrlF toxin-antitoxin module